jgi:hypothetical protein
VNLPDGTPQTRDLTPSMVFVPREYAGSPAVLLTYTADNQSARLTVGVLTLPAPAFSHQLLRVTTDAVIVQFANGTPGAFDEFGEPSRTFPRFNPATGAFDLETIGFACDFGDTTPPRFEPQPAQAFTHTYTGLREPGTVHVVTLRAILGPCRRDTPRRVELPPSDVGGPDIGVFDPAMHASILDAPMVRERAGGKALEAVNDVNRTAAVFSEQPERRLELNDEARFGKQAEEALSRGFQAVSEVMTADTDDETRRQLWEFGQIALKASLFLAAVRGPDLVQGGAVDQALRETTQTLRKIRTSEESAGRTLAYGEDLAAMLAKLGADSRRPVLQAAARRLAATLPAPRSRPPRAARRTPAGTRAATAAKAGLPPTASPTTAPKPVSKAKAAPRPPAKPAPRTPPTRRRRR